MILILAMLILFVFVPFVARQEKRRKAKFEERKLRFMSIGAEHDDDDDDELATPKTSPMAPPTTTPIKPITVDDGNPYRPPQDEQ